MIVAAALCPCPPLLVRELTGRDPVLPALRLACATAVSKLLADAPDVVVVVAPAESTATWPAEARGDFSGFGAPGAPARAPRGAAEVPWELALGGRLLDQAGYGGARVMRSVGHDEPVARCAELGAEIGGAAGRVGLLVMGDGSARRGIKAPGHLDERAIPFDAEVERAVSAGDLGALRSVDPALARQLMAAGRPVWQVLAGAFQGRAPATDVLYADAPFGVAYLVAYLA
jgi:hypothetical protein